MKDLVLANEQLDDDLPNGFRYVGETDSPGEVLYCVDEALMEFGLEIEFAICYDSPHSFRIIKRK